MRMFNRLPRCVYIKNERFEINTDFRIFVEFEKDWMGRNKKKAVKKCLSRFYPLFFDIVKEGLVEEAVDKFIWFYKCAKEDVETNEKASGKESNVRTFDYEYDADLIWGAFKAQYNVELDSAHLHWWKFKAMWNSLDSKCEFNKVRSYRSYKGKDEELLRLKEAHKLPLTYEEKEAIIRHQQIYKELLNIQSQ